MKLMRSNGLENFLFAYTEAVVCIYNQLEANLKNEGTKGDFSMLIPLLFLIRHTIEIALKIAIKQFDNSYEIEGRAEETHGLFTLLCKLQKFSDIDFIKDYPITYKLVKWIDDFDKDGAFFKYPIDKKWNNTLKDVEIKLQDLESQFKGFVDEYTLLVNKYFPVLFEPTESTK